jgi:hypothetical protein
MNTRFLGRLTCIALTATAGVAMAAPPPPLPPTSYCLDLSDVTSPGNTLPDPIWAPSGLSVANVTLDGRNADGCYGIVKGNLPNTSFDYFGSVYPLVAKSDGAAKGAIIDGIDFSVEATGVKSGSWTLTLADIDGPNDLPALFDLVIGLKAGNNYAAYYFDDAELDDVDSGTGTFTIAFNNFKGNTNGLSHLNVYARYESSGSPPPGPTTFALDAPQQIPEPESLTLLVIGLAGMLAARGRRASALRSMRG